MKSIEFNQHQIEDYKNGVTMFLIPIDFSDRIEMSEQIGMDMLYPDCLKKYKEIHAPLQKGDEFFIKYDRKREVSRGYSPFGIELKSEVKYPAKQMREKESEFKDIVLDVEIKRVQDICAFDFFATFSFEQSNGVGGFDILYEIGDEELDETTICEYFDDYIENQGIKYENNPYVFLYTIKGINNV